MSKAKQLAKKASKVVRDASSGRFVPKGEAKKRPKSTVSEARKRAPAKRLAKCPECHGKGLNLLNFHELCGVCGGAGSVKA